MTIGSSEVANPASTERPSHPRSRPALHWRSQFTTLAVLLLPAVIFGMTLYPGVGGSINPGDSAKFQYLGKILGVPHDPGYPQYMILNHLWTRLPTPLELATHVNLLSAVFTLIAGGLIFSALRRLSDSGIAAAVATWTLLFSSAVWTISTEAEVYSLHLAYVGGVLWTGVRWRETLRRRWLVVLIAVSAFSLGNHPLAVVLLPAALLVAVGSDARALVNGRIVATAMVLIALSLGQYFYLWWRSHVGNAFLDGMPRNVDLGGVMDTMMGTRFTERYLLRGGLDEALERGQALSGDLVSQLTVPAAILAAIGFVVLMRRDWVLGAFVTLLGVGPAAFVIGYQIGDWGGYVAPIWVAVVTLATVGTTAPQRTTVRVGVLALWMIALTWLTASTFQTMYTRTNRADLSPLIQIADSGAIVLTYVERGRRGYREKQLTNYYRRGLQVRRRFGLEFLLARRAFERRRVYLRDRPIYFTPGPVKQYVDQYRMDYVEREIAGDPPYRYFVSAPRADRGTLRIEPLRGGGAAVWAGDTELVTPTHPVQVVVIAETDHRVKGTGSFEWEERDEVGFHPAASLLKRVTPFDWVAIVLQGDQLPQHGALVGRVLTAVGAGFEAAPAAERSLILVGQRSVRTGWHVLADPDHTIDIALGSDEPPISGVP